MASDSIEHAEAPTKAQKDRDRVRRAAGTMRQGAPARRRSGPELQTEALWPQLAVADPYALTPFVIYW